MKHFTQSLAGIFLLIAAGQAAATTPPVREATYYVGANVDAQGHITQTQFPSAVSSKLVQILSAGVRQWRFKPATMNGQPVPAHTFLHVELTATPDAQGHYALHLRFITNGPRITTGYEVFPYPQSCVERHEGAMLYLNFTVEPDGKLAAATVIPQIEGEHFDPHFSRTVLASARQWQFEPEQVDGHPVATHVRIPIIFTLSDGNGTGVGGLSPADIALLHKQDLANAAKGASKLSQQDSAVALDSPLQPANVAAVALAP